ncbi:aspartyl protease family protein [Mesorhizobium sp.]|uniref:aspartyl protease family protein n=1 Tax=Mesorhizobium sp. TaxID=1871066 RepID=UPI002585CB6B|nr:aspartyl protease family protein [Mesorhizobium sp.]
MKSATHRCGNPKSIASEAGSLSRLFIFCTIMTLLPLQNSATGQEPPTSPSDHQAVVAFDAVTARNWIDLVDTEHSGLIIINVVVDGKVLPALLDTGTSVTVLDETIARSFGMEVRRYGKLVGNDGRKIALSEASLESTAIGGWKQEKGMIGVADLSEFRAAADNAFSLIIGSDFLAHVALQVDWDGHRVRLLPSGTRALEGTSVPLRLESPFNVLVTTLSINGRQFDRVLVDTGDNGGGVVQTSLLPQLSMPADRLTDVSQFGLAGPYVADYFRADEIEFGNVRVAKVPIQAMPTVSRGTLEYEAQVGMGLLSRLNFLLDPQAGEIVLAPRSAPAPPLDVSTSGVQGIYRSDGLSIFHVMRGSPAEEAGLRAGDLICMVDGAKVDASWESGEQRRWSVAEPGRRVNLRLCDGRSKTFTLADFY